MRHLLAIMLLLAAAPAAAGPKDATVRMPIIVSPPTQPGVEQPLEPGGLSNVQQARYRSSVMLGADVVHPGKLTKLGAGDRLIEVLSRGRDAPTTMYCRALDRQGEGDAAPMACLADADADGTLDQLWIGTSAVQAPFVPLELVRFVGAITPVPFRVAEPVPGDSFNLGVSISGTNPLLGRHHFYAAVRGDGRRAYLIRTRRSVGISPKLRVIDLAGATFEVSRYPRQPYRVRDVQPWPTQMELYDNWPPEQMIVVVPG